MFLRVPHSNRNYSDNENYYICCRKAIPKEAKLHLNENIPSETEIYKIKSPL